MLVPGFTKRFDVRAGVGVTYLWGVPIGRFELRPATGGGTELHYLRWPVTDELERAPLEGGSIRSRGRLRMGARRLTFCTFRLER